MSKEISENKASKVADKGILIGTLKPTRESKGTWSELYYYEGELISVVYSDPNDAWIVLGEKVEESEIEKYVDNYEKALLKLKEIK